jgi:hypothetical protein
MMMPWQSLIDKIDLADQTLHGAMVTDPVLLMDIAKFDSNKAGEKAKLRLFLQ